MIQFLAVLTAAFAVGALCRRSGISAPLPLIVSGAAIGLLPGSSSLSLDPDVVLSAALPPLVFASALTTSYVGLRRNLPAVLWLSVGLVIFTAAVVGLVTNAVLSPIPLAAAFALGAILAPSDAVATSAVASKVGMIRRTRTILEGEALLNDGAALTLFNIAVAAAVAGSISGSELAVIAFTSVVGGIGIGIAGGLLARRVIGLLDDSLLENSLVLIVPFALFAGSEAIEASGFLAVVVAGLILSRGAGRSGAMTRLQLGAIWAVVNFVLESLAFFIVGFELPHLIESMNDQNDLDGVFVPAAAVLTAVILARIVWVVPAMWLPRSWLRKGETRSVERRSVAVAAWAGMRGPVSAFAAVGLPLTLDDGSSFPQRDRLLLITSIVVIATLLLEGSTLGPLMRRLGVTAPESADDGAVAEAHHAATRAAVERLQADLAQQPHLPDDVVEKLRRFADKQSEASEDELLANSPHQAEFRRLRSDMIDAKRRVVFEFRDDGRLPDDVAGGLIHDLDLDEAALER